jgi:hypothetical protein
MSGKKILSTVLSFLIGVPAFLGLFSFDIGSAYAATEAERIKIVEITSLGKPQPGQKHRSSGNFSTQGVPGGFSKFYWEVSGTQQPDSVKFDVKRDKSGGTDPVIYPNLKNKSVTDIQQIRSLYIADPKGSYGGDFRVTVYGAN